MTPEEREFCVLDCAKIRAINVHSKLPKEKKGVIAVEDIQQNLYIHYMQQSHSYDESRPFKPWILSVMNSRGIDEITGVWDAYSKELSLHDPSTEQCVEHEDYKDDGSSELVVLDLQTPEMLCISYYEELEMNKKIGVLITEVKDLCDQFGISFNKDDYTESFIKVLDYTLNKMSDEDFKKIPEEQQVQLARYGDAMNNNNIQVTSTGKMRNLGIVSTIRECVQNGTHDFKEVKEILKSQGLEYTDASIRTIIWKEKKRAGIAIERKQRGLLQFVQDKFDSGRGVVTVAEMLHELRTSKLTHSPSTVRTYVQKLRANAGLTKSRPADS